MNLRRIGMRGLILAASACASLLLVELGFRWAEPDNPPGTTYGAPVVKNRLGLRDRDYDGPKPDDVFRIVALGDSFLWGVGLDIEATLSRELERDLALRLAPVKIEVVHAAVPGFNTVQELEQLRELDPVLEPDLVFLLYNLNDIEYLPALDPQPSPTEAATPVVEVDADETITKFSRNAGFRGVVLAVERRSAFVRFAVPRVGAALRRVGLLNSPEFSWVEKIYSGFSDSNPGWRESRRALGEIHDLARGSDAELFVAIYPLLVDLQEYQGGPAHATIRHACRELGIECADLLPLFEGTEARSHWINFLDSHPNQAAHRRVARHLAPLLHERIQRRLAAGPP